MFGILVLLFTVVPALEIYLLINIGSKIGGVNTIAVVILTGIVGAALAKSQGLAIINKIQKDLNQGALPADQIIHGLLVFGGGLLLLTPGFLTDILGLSMVIPGTRHILVKVMKAQLEKGIQSGNIFFSSNSGAFKSQGFSNSDFTNSDFTNSDFTNSDFSNSFNEFDSEQSVDKSADIIEVDFVEKKTKED